MKVIYVMADTFRRDHTTVYGGPSWGPIRTPNLERFAAQAAVFDNAYVGSFPTVPNRRDTQLGHGDKGVPFNRWKALDPDEVTFLQYLTEKKVPSMLISDTANNLTGNINLQRDYTAWTLNRGQEGDKCWLDHSVPIEYPVPRHLIRYREAMWHQILLNRAHREVETDWFSPGTYTIAMKWLEQNYKREDFFLWIDTFDPHEPWDPPQYYIDMYDPGYRGRVFDAPTYGLRKRMGITGRELQHIRARYAGEVTMVDTWFGRLMAKLENLGILDDTIVIFTSDHGTAFDGPGDLGMVQKFNAVGADGMAMSAGRPMKEPKMFFPMSANIVRIPLIIRMPGLRKAKRIGSIVQPWDITATILDAFGTSRPKNVTGESVLPLISGKKAHWPRDVAVMGTNTLAQAMNGRWMYTVWSGQRPGCLYEWRKDVDLKKNLLQKQPATAKRLHGKIVGFMREQNIEEEAIARYQP